MIARILRWFSIRRQLREVRRGVGSLERDRRKFLQKVNRARRDLESLRDESQELLAHAEALAEESRSLDRRHRTEIEIAENKVTALEAGVEAMAEQNRAIIEQFRALGASAIFAQHGFQPRQTEE